MSLNNFFDFFRAFIGQLIVSLDFMNECPK